MIRTTVAKLKSKLSNYDDNAEVLIDGNISIATIIPLDLKEEDNHASFKFPSSINKYLNWDLSNTSDFKKIFQFVEVLLSVWNPNDSLSSLDLKKLNNTTLSRALFVSIKNADRREIIDSLIKNLIRENLDYLKIYYQRINK